MKTNLTDMVMSWNYVKLIWKKPANLKKPANVWKNTITKEKLIRNLKKNFILQIFPHEKRMIQVFSEEKIEKSK